ncbi:interleukin-17-4 [Elysia marginata]|uniref:Interleukin-17-4 n=1 Tax=Elysia marginata TaxID=1093978 RepID=A0AAV4EFS1_9GAST|nr:interleukin-17-4 [Elysia marginata]
MRLNNLAATSLFPLLLSVWLVTPIYSHIIGGSYNTDFHLARNRGSPGEKRATNVRRSLFDGLNIGLTRGRTVSHRSRHNNHHLRRHNNANSVGYEMLDEIFIESLPFQSLASSSPRLRRDIPARTIFSTTKLPADNKETKTSMDLDQQNLHHNIETDTIYRAAPSNNNPFLRARRDTAAADSASASISQTCSLPTNLPAQVAELNTFLANSEYIGVLPEQDGHISLPSNQPENSCPAASGSWWPRQESNLKSTCPWIWEELDNGPNAYPRYLRQAKCMCQKCVDSDVYQCQEFRHNVTIFRLKGCQNGLAVMEKDRVAVTLGCYCAAPEPEASADTHDNDSNGDVLLPSIAQREGTTLEIFCRGNVKEAYKCKQLAKLRESDHDMVQVIPKYRSVLKSVKLATKIVNIYNEESIGDLQACLDCTDWGVFMDSSEDLG